MSELEQAVLDHESEFYRHAGAKEAAVRERFGLSGVRYHQLVNALIDESEALAYAPATVNRLRRLRDHRRALRRSA